MAWGAHELTPPRGAGLYQVEEHSLSSRVFTQAHASLKNKSPIPFFLLFCSGMSVSSDVIVRHVRSLPLALQYVMIQHDSIS